MILFSEIFDVLVSAVSFLVLSTAVVELVVKMVSRSCIHEFHNDFRQLAEM